MKRTILVMFLLLASISFVAATGQPSQSCQNEAISPNGFLTAGFAHAGTVYAGSPGTPSLANGNPNAVSQYDVACYQLTQHQ